MHIFHSGNLDGADSNTEDQESPLYQCRSPLQYYLWAVGASLLTALLATPLRPYLDLANIVMLFLLTVVLVAVRLGRGPAVVATCTSVAAFDFFFVLPRFSFAIEDWQYVVTFGVMLVVSLITAHLTSDLRYQAQIASSRENRARALYEFARALSGALRTEQIFDTTRAFIARTFQAQAILLLPDETGQLQAPAITTTNRPLIDGIDLGIAQSVFKQATSTGIGTGNLPESHFFYLPLIAPMRTRGVLAIQPEKRSLIPEHRQQLDTFAALAAIALERIHYIEVAQDALIRMESERLRNSLLAALSHDLRTPLTTIVGLSESLATYPSLSTQKAKEFVCMLRDEAIRMRNLVTNLLDMARIQSGEVKLNLQWQPFEEVVGCALRASQHTLQKHHIQTMLSPNLPLIQFDAILIERVLCNLLENAAKYTPEGSHITIAAKTSGKYLEIAVSDNGPGLPPGKEEAIFEKFTRGKPESATPGVGLGLAICRAIAQAHGGAIGARSAQNGGASIVLTLVLGTPPDIPQMEDINPEHSHHA